jgi:hypothetical protein
MKFKRFRKLILPIQLTFVAWMLYLSYPAWRGIPDDVISGEFFSNLDEARRILLKRFAGHSKESLREEFR